MSQIVRLCFLSACALGAACGSTPTLEPTYEACATDENWVSFDDYEKTNRVTTSGSNLPQWVSPAMDAAVVASSTPVFQWQPNVSDGGNGNGNVMCPQFQPSSRGGLQVAHLPPVSGTIYDVHFAVDGKDAYRVITTRQRAGVPLNLIGTWTGKTVTATLYSAKMLVNEIAEGPYQAATLRFQVTP